MFRVKVTPMLNDDNETIKRICAAALAEAMADAQQQMEDVETAEILGLAELAVQGRHVVRWRPPGPSRPVCPACGGVDEFYQSVETGCVHCRCIL